MKTRFKRAHEKVAKFSVSLAPTLYDYTTDQVRGRGYASVSSYLADLIRRDKDSAAKATV